MLNQYKIELVEIDNSVKAKLYVFNNNMWESIGVIYSPSGKLKTKEDFMQFFTSIGNTLYGQEKKAEKKASQEEKFLRETLALIKKKNSRKQKEIQS